MIREGASAQSVCMLSTACARRDLACQAVDQSLEVAVVHGTGGVPGHDAAVAGVPVGGCIARGKAESGLDLPAIIREWKGALTVSMRIFARMPSVKSW